ncbi:peptidoglycan-binding protein [Pedobacter frigoris]|uniref:Peptidoglycan-binding protein n=1 Tax=Pedobacter frigoris TaxID=2571272 RepID=A0A4U1CHY0_9SPHI|nr:peptidoglycan-binding protein [Pedobacter frigoris]
MARAAIGVKEATGKNDGARVEQYLRYTGLPKGNALCASFVFFCFWKAGYKEPKTAWSPALFPKDRVVAIATSRNAPRNDKKWRDDKRGLVFGIYFPDLKRIAHVGFVEMERGKYIQTIEGNTGSDGGREGNGVFRRLRHKRTISKYADWLN